MEPGIQEAEEAPEEVDLDQCQEEPQRTLETSTCLTDPVTTLEIALSEWTRCVTNHSRTCTVALPTRSRETELSVPRRAFSRGSAETPGTDLKLKGTEVPNS